MVKRYRKQLITLLKFVVTALALFLVFRKIDLPGMAALLRNISIGPLAFAALFFILSKVLSSIRLHNLFNEAGMPIGQMANARLYLLGMFYNLFLPGGIGGDGYKIFVLNRHYQLPARTIFAAILLDRLSGVFMLTLLALALIHWMGAGLTYTLLAVAAMLVLMLIFYGVVFFLFRKFLRSFYLMNLYSLGVQLLQLCSAYFILVGLGQNERILPYLFLFLVSSIVTIIPITIGGAGARELTFLYGAKWFGVNVELAVALSFTFYLITLITSFAGIYFAISGVKLAPSTINAHHSASSHPPERQ